MHSLTVCWRAFQGVAVVRARLSGLQHYCMLSDVCCGVGFMTTVYKCCRGGGLNLDFHASGRFIHTLTDQTLNTNIYGPWLLFITVVVVVVIVVVYSVLLCMWFLACCCCCCCCCLTLYKKEEEKYQNNLTISTVSAV